MELESSLRVVEFCLSAEEPDQLVFGFGGMVGLDQRDEEATEDRGGLVRVAGLDRSCDRVEQVVRPCLGWSYERGAVARSGRSTGRCPLPQ